MFSLKHVKRLSCKFQIVTAWWAPAWEEEGPPVFMQASLKLLKNSHSSCWFYLSFPKTRAPAWWYTGAQMRETMSQRSILVSAQLWPPSSVLDSYSQGPVQLLSVGWTPAAHYPPSLSNQVLLLTLNTSFISSSSLRKHKSDSPAPYLYSYIVSIMPRWFPCS